MKKPANNSPLPDSNGDKNKKRSKQNQEDNQDDQMELKLKKTLFRWDCPHPDLIGDYYLGYISKENKETVKKHIKSCLHCQEELKMLKQYLRPDLNELFTKTKNTIAESIESVLSKVNHKLNEVISTDTKPVLALRGSDSTNTMSTYTIKLDQETVQVFIGKEIIDDQYILKAQFGIKEEMEYKFINALVEIWQNDKLQTTALIDDLCSFTCQVSDLSASIIRVTNKTGLLMSFELD